MKTIKCDKCKKELVLKTFLDKMNEVKLSYSMGETIEIIKYSINLDLCEDCYKKVYDAINRFIKE